MLKDGREAEIMAGARQPGLRAPGRPDTQFSAIVEDFDLAERFEGQRILDLGPGQFDFGEIVRSFGGEVAGVDNDPAVISLGEYRGYETHQLDVRTLDWPSSLGIFDGVFCRGSLNAVWFDDDEAHLAWADGLASLVRADGWAWLAPWNYPQEGAELDRGRYFELVYAQFLGLARYGFLALHFPHAEAARYGLRDGGFLQEGETVYVKNVTVKRELLQYVVTRSDYDGFLAQTRRTASNAGGGAIAAGAGVGANPVPNGDPALGAEPPPDQPGPPRLTTESDRIIADFGLEVHCAGARVLSVGAGDLTVAGAAQAAGAAEVVIIDRDPGLVDKAATMGFTAQALSPRELLGNQALGEYDVVLCRGAINAFWFGIGHSEQERWVARLASLVKAGGAAWIAPWNSVSQPTGLTEDDRREIVETQLGAFLAAEFVAHELDRRTASFYGVSADVENLVLFTKGLDADAVLGADTRAAPPNRPRTDRASQITRRAPSTASRPVPEVRPEAGAPILPIEYHTGLLDLLAANPEVFNVITYDDLPWGDDLDYEALYPTEWQTWLQQVRDEHDQRIHVLIQHDVDENPELANGLASYEALVGVPTNIMVFRRQHDRPLLEDEGTLEFRPYDIDVPLLQRLQRDSGFVIGYHANCVEHALWDRTAAKRLFVEDVEILRESFPIRYFSPHGGVAKNGVNNRSLELPDDLRGSIRWVHNRYGPRFHGYYSDGGFVEPLPGDIRDFVRTWQPGCRYRILTHPQYYGTDAVNSDYRVDWYQDVHRAYEAGQRELWDDVWPDALS